MDVGRKDLAQVGVLARDTALMSRVVPVPVVVLLFVLGAPGCGGSTKKHAACFR